MALRWTCCLRGWLRRGFCPRCPRRGARPRQGRAPRRPKPPRVPSYTRGLAATKSCVGWMSHRPCRSLRRASRAALRRLCLISASSASCSRACGIGRGGAKSTARSLASWVVCLGLFSWRWQLRCCRRQGRLSCCVIFSRRSQNGSGPTRCSYARAHTTRTMPRALAAASLAPMVLAVVAMPTPPRAPTAAPAAAAVAAVVMAALPPIVPQRCR